MYVIAVGLNHHTAPVEIREKFSFSEYKKEEQIYSEVMQIKSLYETVIIGTCNRTEIFAVVDQYHTGQLFIKDFLSKWFSIEKEDFDSYLYVKEGQDAIEHLFKVATGLDSMIIGETQILGQVKNSFLEAQQFKATGTVFNYLFKQVITFAKKIHSQTGISENPVSISYASVELAKKNVDLKDKKALIIGAGETSKLTATYLETSGIKQIMVANRTIENAKYLAGCYNGRAFSLDEIIIPLTEVDVVVSATGADSIIVSKSLLEEAMNKRNYKPLLIIDIAVPRDIELLDEQIENLKQYDIDDLEGIVSNNIKEREKIACQVSEWINIEIDKFYQWINTLGVVPLIAALKDKSLKIQEETMASIENKLPHLSEKDLKVVRKHTRSIINQMIKNPVIRLKEAAVEKDAESFMESFIKIFDISEEDLDAYLQYEKEKSLM